MGNSLKSFKEQPHSTAYEPLISVSENENMRVFSFAELKKATKNFRRNMVVVDHGWSVRTFYKCYIDRTTFTLSRTDTGTAVSVMDCDSLPHTLHECEGQVKFLGQIYHPNLVKLLGYCCKDNKSNFLVFEYFHKGSLDRHIYGKEEALTWEIRVNIAIGIARGLVFIHSIKNIPLHQELRMHNIMLDEQNNAKLLYLVPNEQYLDDDERIIRGDVYNSPEWIKGDYVEAKTDVFTFGLILLALLTGSKSAVKKEITKRACVWTSLLSDDHKIGEIIDPRLGNNCPMNAVTQMGTLIRRCTKWDKIKRPLMQEVLDTLNYIAEIKD
ncbi:hypothetical protein EUTSA_v10002608mg [Eutrema salsugineum]|uniref:Protein kinase domain-containing protein n=1 Tax=Eutrema salsugineum TaxID=72664 RepID=V4KH80_EUTSA|nr:putative inactive serine/threonine-protein kinase At5g11400 [Eutrema salsugineum]ESQ37185.1 hypothetical protein EUTSA_v10002608mg [Eutrema salsugineum]